jgi:tripartite-type tricarboxylate transporter receptor subunit TctC
LIAQPLSAAWGQQVIVDNRPGAGTIIGTEHVAKSTPDGYTVLMVSTSTAVNPSLRKRLPYDTTRDFSRVTQLVASPNVLVSHPSLPVRSVGDLIKLAKSRPNQINYGSGGPGTATHLGAALFCLVGKVSMTHVPYKGDAPASLDLLSGQISWMFGTILPIMPYIKSGRMRAIAVSSPKRAPMLPDVPAVAETLPGFEATSWYGMFVPASTPPQAIEKINAEVTKIIKTEKIRMLLANGGTEVVGSSPAEFEKYFLESMKKWGEVIKEAGISIE